MQLDDVRSEFLRSLEGATANEADIIRTLNETAFLYHPLNKGWDSWLSHSQLLETLQTMDAITDRSCFNTVLVDGDLLKLTEIADALMVQIIDALDERDLTAALTPLTEMMHLNVLDRKEVTNKIIKVIQATGDAIKATTLEAILKCEFDEAEQSVKMLRAVTDKVLTTACELASGLQQISDELTKDINKAKWKKGMYAYHNSRVVTLETETDNNLETKLRSPNNDISDLINVTSLSPATQEEWDSAVKTVTRLGLYNPCSHYLQVWQSGTAAMCQERLCQVEKDAQMNIGGVLKVSVRYSDNISQPVEVHLLKPANKDEWFSAVKAVTRLNSDCTMIFFCAQQWKKETPVLYDDKMYMIRTDPVLLSGLIVVELKWPNNISTHSVDVRELRLLSMHKWEKAVKQVFLTGSHNPHRRHLVA